MANPPKQKGSRFERVISDYLCDNWSDVIDRRVLSGSKDRGDLANVRVAGHRVTVECKNHARIELSNWLDQAVEEADNDGALMGMVVHKRKGRADGSEQYVTMRLGDLIALLRACLGD